MDLIEDNFIILIVLGQILMTYVFRLSATFYRDNLLHQITIQSTLKLLNLFQKNDGPAFTGKLIQFLQSTRLVNSNGLYIPESILPDRLIDWLLTGFVLAAG